MMAILSPRLKPRAASPQLSARTLSKTSAQLHDCQMPKSFSRMAVRLPRRAALSINSFGKVSSPSMAALAAATGASLLAHENAKDKIPGIDRGLSAGDTITVGKTVELEVLDTPGHTMSHVCLVSHTDQPALFCGDTLFNAGAGNCHSGGHPSALYDTFATQLAGLPDETLIYPGHDYIANNLRFTLDREPDNGRAAALLEDVADQDTDQALVSTLGLEKEINTFFRLHSPTVIKVLRQAFPDLPDKPDPETVFLKLRELRNDW